MHDAVELFERLIRSRPLPPAAPPRPDYSGSPLFLPDKDVKVRRGRGWGGGGELQFFAIRAVTAVSPNFLSMFVVFIGVSFNGKLI